MTCLRLALAAAALSLLAGCGADTSGDDVSTEPRPTGSVQPSIPPPATGAPGTSPSGPATGTASPPAEDPSDGGPVDPTDLRITIDNGTGQTRTYTLRCDPPGGDHPDPDAACAALAQMSSAFAPLPKGLLCTQIYGGPQTAKVEGTYRGVPTLAEFRRTDGCEISRWDAYAAVLSERGGAAGS
jgi:hypothetical protein